jgi:Domain of unknown function (DUF5666)
MRRFFALSLVALAAIWPANPAGAQELKSRGTLTAMAADSITVKVGTTDVKFAVDDKTAVTAPGGSTKAKQAAAAGKAGPKLSEVLKVGDAVEVSYTEAGGRHASEIRKVSSPGSGGVPAKRAAGTVSAVSASSLTIDGSGGGGAKFTQTFVIDGKTHVIARGASKSLGAGAPVTNAVGKGDTVSVSFDESGGSLHANEIRVTAKASK